MQIYKFTMMSFLDHPAEREELIEISHSIPKIVGSKTMGLEDVDHLIVDPHGSLALPKVRGLDKFLSDHDYEMVRRYLAVARDLGMPEYCDVLLKMLSNSLAIRFNVNRGLVDPNRTPAYAMGNIMKKAPREVRTELMARHIRALRAVDEIIANLKPGVKITLAHSTEPFNDADRSVNDLDLSDPANLARYLEVRTNVGSGHGSVIPVCFITGRGDGWTYCDDGFRKRAEAHLDFLKIPYSHDDPYATKAEKHLTSRYMRARPGDVNAIDLPRDMLATGEIADGTFSLTESVADSKKVERIAELFAESLRAAGLHKLR